MNVARVADCWLVVIVESEQLSMSTLVFHPPFDPASTEYSIGDTRIVHTLCSAKNFQLSLAVASGLTWPVPGSPGSGTPRAATIHNTSTLARSRFYIRWEVHPSITTMYLTYLLIVFIHCPSRLSRLWRYVRVVGHVPVATAPRFPALIPFDLGDPLPLDARRTRVVLGTVTCQALGQMITKPFPAASGLCVGSLNLVVS